MMLKWIALLAIAAMAGLGVALPKTNATQPVDGASQPAQASFARVAARRCGTRGAGSYCRSAARRMQKRSAHTNLPPNLMIGIGF